MKRSAAVLFDRDGTLCEDVGYLADAAKLEPLPGAAQAVGLVEALGFRTAVVTNQSAVGRGRLNAAGLESIHQRLNAHLRQHSSGIEGFFSCPHHPDEALEPYRVHCSCRKPAPGLLLQAAAQLEFDLGCSFMVGDRYTDVEAGHRAGANSILVLTGRGTLEWQNHRGRAGYQPQFVARDVVEAAEWIRDHAEGQHSQVTTGDR